jgi:hypothetical protein
MTSSRGNLTVTHSPIAADDSWHHVAVTMDATSNVSLYIDGAQIQVESTAAKASDFAGTAITQAYLAKSRGNDPYFNGSIDELRIACRAYTPDEIKNLAHK